MLAVEDALAFVAEHAVTLAPRQVALENAAGLVLAESVVSDVNSPPYDKALMDGYAVVSSDRTVIRKVLEEVGAGSVPRRPVTPGTATRLMTGAPLPEGADAVVPFEETETVDDLQVRLLRTDAKPGQHMLAMGAALAIGDSVFARGTRLRPIEIGILAEIGRAAVTVFPRPRVAILPTGNELVAVHEQAAAGQIRNSNGPMLAAAVAEAGGEAIELPVARDDRSELARLIAAGLEADVLLLCGGVSAGKFDLVPGALADAGVREVFHKVALRPGKPLWFGVWETAARRVLVFGLPGNPVSSLVCCELFARPAIAALAGRGFTGRQEVGATLAHDFQHKGGRAACLPAKLQAGTVTVVRWHGSADLAALTQANALVRMSAEPANLRAGAPVRVIPL